jgi:hypothetical protein
LKEAFVVVQQRSEIGRNRTLHFLVILLAAAVLAGVISRYPATGGPGRLVLLLLAVLSLAGVAIAAIQLYAYPKRSQVLLFHLEDRMIAATNNQHEGYKLRFLRDILGDSVRSFSDEERLTWKELEADGYYPALIVKNPRKILMLRLCTMVFDDVFVVDRSGRWEHHDASNTPNPHSRAGRCRH